MITATFLFVGVGDRLSDILKFRIRLIVPGLYGSRKSGIGMVGESLHYVISVVVKGCLCLSVCVIYN